MPSVASACPDDASGPTAAFLCGAAGTLPEARAAQAVLRSPVQVAPQTALPPPIVQQLHRQTAASARPALTVPPILRPKSEDVTGSLKGDPSEDKPSHNTFEKARPSRGMTLFEAVAAALLSHPEIRAAEARVREAKAGVAMAESGLYPQGETRLATGGSLSGNSTGRSVYERANPDGSARLDASISLRQLLYDFGATRADIERNAYVKDAERMRLFDKIDEIALRTAQAYLKILESRALLSLVDETVAAHRRLAQIVQANQREGNGTAADVNRVSSRLTDMMAIRSDVSLQLKGAEEQFHRMTKIMPGGLAPAPQLRTALPSGPEDAVAIMRRNNPRIGALSAMARSIDHEREFQRLGALPKFQLEVDGDTKNFAALNRHRNEGEARALITMRYRFMDGGLNRATLDQLSHRREANLFTMQNEDEQTSADIRQAYRAIESAGRKGKLISGGVSTAQKVQELYLEQFKAGRRTVFELLDAQMSSFSSRRSAIESRYEGERATFEILRHTGKLAEVMSASAGRQPVRPGPPIPVDAEVTASLPKRAVDARNTVSEARGAVKQEPRSPSVASLPSAPVRSSPSQGPQKAETIAASAPQTTGSIASPQATSTQSVARSYANRPGFLAFIGIDRR